MTRSERIADQLDRYWRGNLWPRLEGLTDEEYFWEPVPGCWSIRRQGTSAVTVEGTGEWAMDFVSPAPEPAPVTTIAWRLAHIVVGCLGYRVGWHFGGEEMDSGSFAYAGSADEALKQLEEMYGRWHAGVVALSDEQLDNPPAVGPEQFPMEGIVLHVNRELIHHGAEISLLRDLWLRRGGMV